MAKDILVSVRPRREINSFHAESVWQYGTAWRQPLIFCNYELWNVLIPFLHTKSGHALQVTLTVLDPKGLKGQSERIEIQSNGGDEFFEITKAALGRTDWYDGLPSTGSNTGLIAVSDHLDSKLALFLLNEKRRLQNNSLYSFLLQEKESRKGNSWAEGLVRWAASNTGLIAVSILLSFSSGIVLFCPCFNHLGRTGWYDELPVTDSNTGLIL
jgi:hypothetical protein